jgi:hypothetical protein
MALNGQKGGGYDYHPNFKGKNMTQEYKQLSNEEMKIAEGLLPSIISDTLSCWEATRLKGRSASMSCDGNISIILIKSFDKLYEMVKNT